MKDEMNLYYPEITQESVVITGTPQFEFYQKKELIISKEEFAVKFGLNPKKKWVMYSGGDTRTSPYDQEYLEDLTVALMNQEDVQIILRKSPADFSERFDTIIQKFENKIFVLDPVWGIGDTWSSNTPKVEDFEMLANLAFHCDLAINVGSTVAHDFANFNKPTIYVNYEQDYSSSWSVKQVNSFQHFRSMPSQSAVVFINFPEDWKETILKVINNPNEFAKDRIDWFHKINHKDDEHASKKIANILLL